MEFDPVIDKESAKIGMELILTNLQKNKTVLEDYLNNYFK